MDLPFLHWLDRFPPLVIGDELWGKEDAGWVPGTVAGGSAGVGREAETCRNDSGGSHCCCYLD